MKIIDTFIWLGPHEADLLYLKLLLESPCVDEWVGVENHYSYRGDFKGPSLAKVLEEDRFAPYRDRFTWISIPDNFSVAPGTFGSDTIDPRPFAEAEWKLRDAPTTYLLQKYRMDHDMVFLTDVDEMIDFTDPWRRDRILHYLGREDTIQFDRFRYTWDYDNRWFREKLDMVTPCFSIGALKNGGAHLHDKKWVGTPVPIENHNPFIFEYSFVFPYDGILYKFNTSLHTRWVKDKIDASIEYNHWTMTAYQGDPDRNNRWHWFETAALSERNSPAYVRENLAKLKTNLVPEDYKERRLRRYGYCPNFPENEVELNG